MRCGAMGSLSWCDCDVAGTEARAQPSQVLAIRSESCSHPAAQYVADVTAGGESMQWAGVACDTGGRCYNVYIE